MIRNLGFALNRIAATLAAFISGALLIRWEGTGWLAVLFAVMSALATYGMVLSFRKEDAGA